MLTTRNWRRRGRHVKRRLATCKDQKFDREFVSTFVEKVGITSPCGAKTVMDKVYIDREVAAGASASARAAALMGRTATATATATTTTAPARS